jgi:diadenosine tetraphosphate (Ap4A) HIT family hydrolase
MDCESCRSLAGEVVLTNGPRLLLDDHWVVEHVQPVSIAGWLVLVLRRHARALHELTAEEGQSLGRWLPALTAALHQATGCELEYVMQFAEGEGFHHVHLHLIARTPVWPAHLTGPAVFAAMETGEPISGEEATRVIEAVGAAVGVAPTALPD